VQEHPDEPDFVEGVSRWKKTAARKAQANGAAMNAEYRAAPSKPVQPHGSIIEVFLVFLGLGCTSFGGPIAHLGYFQREIVERRRWCGDSAMAELVALAQSLPGPSSSQVGFALGIVRAGWLGGVAAWLGFTLPSALLMLAFAHGRSSLNTNVGERLLHGLQLVAVAVVAQAVLSMRSALAPDRVRMGVALAATGIILFVSPRFSTPIAIAFGACAGLLFCVAEDFTFGEQIDVRISKWAAVGAGALSLSLLAIFVVLANVFTSPAIQIFSAFYRAGALVFGGGHVILPLLEDTVVSPGWVTQQSFLAGYGAAQALPGPLFSIGAYLGASVRPGTHPLGYGFLALTGISAPGLLAMTAVLPFWTEWRERRHIQAALRGVNASVVGILIAALFNPLWNSTVHTASDFWIALLAFSLLVLWKVQPWVVVLSASAVALLLR
jgi:chromate transporter